MQHKHNHNGNAHRSTTHPLTAHRYMPPKHKTQFGKRCRGHGVEQSNWKYEYFIVDGQFPVIRRCWQRRHTLPGVCLALALLPLSLSLSFYSYFAQCAWHAIVNLLALLLLLLLLTKRNEYLIGYCGFECAWKAAMHFVLELVPSSKKYNQEIWDHKSS